MNDTELQEVKALSAENEKLKKKLAISLENQFELIAERDSYKKARESSIADSAVIAAARDTFQQGFEKQQEAHNDAIKIIEKLNAEIKALKSGLEQLDHKDDGQPAADK